MSGRGGVPGALAEHRNWHQYVARTRRWCVDSNHAQRSNGSHENRCEHPSVVWWVTSMALGGAETFERSDASRCVRPLSDLDRDSEIGHSGESWAFLEDP